MVTETTNITINVKYVVQDLLATAARLGLIMVTKYPIIIIDVSAIPSRTSGKIEKVIINYRFDENEIGSSVLSGNYNIEYTIDVIPKRKQDALLALSQALREKVDSPKENILDQQVSAKPVFHHFVYQVENADTQYYLRSGGRFDWGTRETDLEGIYKKSEFTDSQKTTFDQLLPWAKDEALQDAQRQVEKVLANNEIPPPVVYWSKKIVMISYRSKESYEFSHALWEKLGKTELFIPRIDSYDLSNGDWSLQLDAWIDTCDCFVAIYSPDYENGPVSQLELKRAINRIGNKEFCLVPILFTANPEIDIVGKQNGVNWKGKNIDDTECFERLVSLLNNVNRNLFDKNS